MQPELCIPFLCTNKNTNTKVASAARSWGDRKLGPLMWPQEGERTPWRAQQQPLQCCKSRDPARSHEQRPSIFTPSRDSQCETPFSTAETTFSLGPAEMHGALRPGPGQAAPANTVFLMGVLERAFTPVETSRGVGISLNWLINNSISKQG